MKILEIVHKLIEFSSNENFDILNIMTAKILPILMMTIITKLIYKFITS